MNDRDAGLPPDFTAEVLELSLEGIVLHDADGVVVSANPAAERLLGVPALSLSGRESLFSSCECRTPDGRELGPEDEPARVALRTGKRAQLARVRALRSDGELAWWNVRAAPLRRTGPGRTANIVGAVSVLTDLSGQVLAEQRLRGELQEDAFSELAGSVAHDFNHLLTVIVGYADLLRHSTAADSAAHEHAGNIHSAAVGAARLTRELSDFSRRQRRPSALADLVQVIEGMQPLLVRLLGPRVRLVLDLDRAHAWVRADSAQVERVVFNLALNARDAMHGSGELVVSTRPVEIDEAFVRSHPGAQPGRFVRMSVRDDGEGMTAATRARLFEPYFTTKPPEQGTGLGLASVWGIVKQFGGYIEVESEPGRGAEFRIDLPAHAGAADRRVAVR